MALDIGDTVPDFELPDQDGTPRRLSMLLEDGPLVLFFYPAALSGGCTAEACSFRDLAAEYRKAGVQRAGISRDLSAKQKKFAELNNFDYPLLSDPGYKVAAAMGVKRKLPLGPMSTRRMTFVIGTDRRVRAIIHDERKMEDHAVRALSMASLRSAGTSPLQADGEDAEND